MTPNDDNLPTIDQGLLDRLVDGELSPSERRALLARLDRVPDGWRRCALAFLEAQCWRETLGALPELAAVSSRPAVLPAPPRASRQSWFSAKNLATVAAMAASFLLALGLGFLIRDGRVPTAPVSSGGAVAQVDEQPLPAPALAPGPIEASPDGPWQTVSLPVQGGSVPVQFPARERESLDEAWLKNLPPAIPQELLHALKHHGHEVETQRGLMPFPMKDGRRLMVPVDQVNIHYAGYPTYQ